MTGIYYNNVLLGIDPGDTLTAEVKASLIAQGYEIKPLTTCPECKGQGYKEEQ